MDCVCGRFGHVWCGVHWTPMHVKLLSKDYNVRIEYLFQTLLLELDILNAHLAVVKIVLQ